MTYLVTNHLYHRVMHMLHHAVDHADHLVGFNPAEWATIAFAAVVATR